MSIEYIDNGIERLKHTSSKSKRYDILNSVINSVKEELNYVPSVHPEWGVELCKKGIKALEIALEKTKDEQKIAELESQIKWYKAQEKYFRREVDSLKIYL